MKFKVGDKVVINSPKWEGWEGVVVALLKTQVVVKIPKYHNWEECFFENELDNEVKKDYFMEALI